MVHYKTRTEDLVPFGQKIAFGSGHLANQLFPAALGVFMVVLVMSLNMNPVLAGILGALPRLLDALTDPVMGFISDNTRSKWGRRKPYILLGSVITGVSFMVMWQLNPENSQTYNFFYFLIVSIFFYIGYTIFATPLIGLGYEMTPDYNERTRLMAVSQLMGQIAWMIAPWFWVIIYDPSIFDSAPEGARTLSIWVGAICMVLGIMPALFNKEIIVPDKEEKASLSLKKLAANTKEFLKGIKLTIRNRSFMRLCGATFFIFNGFQTIAQFSMFIIVYYLFNGDKVAAGTWPAWFGTVSAMATAFVVIPIVTKMSENWGKKKAFVVATAISIIGYALKWWGFNPENPWLIFMPIPFLSFGIGGLFTLMMSMTADVCDLDELNNGKRREGMFGAVYWWMVKLGTALALLTSGIVLHMVGFDESLDQQSAEALTNLRVADIIIPIGTALMAIIIIWKYDITEGKAHQIREKLISVRGKMHHQE
ncbi:glycoside/pentoside/hexuronide:cation symporter, GPH family [Mariniphaga anaerophila]|uniref:Glycoside/pentoside/hexuronide:cation symporter, GPH family n=1 Tax=Mariniphaga anaerophila TaxID=1484053 RepID=A0A1M4YTD6_9BACT|nr:MFS transporter [Mariniphaga anaerophila]SHF08596.1 glycoside/pentoside/hexuronide:cation symporter, GPH family [Mariniphaga anaerophila]